MTPSISRSISNVRLLLCLGVVAIHSTISVSNLDSGLLSSQHILLFFTTNLVAFIVPTFFIISGYLISCKYPSLSSDTYKSLLHKRLRSLILPYLLWNIIAFLLRSILRLSPLGVFTTHDSNFSSPIDFIYQLFLLPEIEPLWFLRNLILLTLLYPAILYLIKHANILSLISLALLENYCNCSGLFWFGIGIWINRNLTNHKIEHITLRQNLSPILAYIILMLIIWSNNIDLNEIFPLNLIIISIGTIGIFRTISFRHLTRHLKDTPLKTIWDKINTQSTIFYIYAFHGIISPYVTKGIEMIITPTNTNIIPLNLLNFLLITTLSIATDYLTRKTVPQAYNILVGKRKHITPTIL